MQLRSLSLHSRRLLTAPRSTTVHYAKLTPAPTLSSLSPVSITHHRPQAVTYMRLFSWLSSHNSNDTSMSDYKLKLEKPPSSFQESEKVEVEVEGVENGKVVFAKVNGEFRALGPKCTHYGAPLVKGVITGDGRITCPWHGACFNTSTGDIENAPALDHIASFPVQIKDGNAYITGSAEQIKAGKRVPDIKCSVAKVDTDGIVIVGGGSGALGAIEGLRESGYKGPITVISAEPYLPIDRTKLSKALLTDLSKLEWRNAQHFNDAGVKFIVGEEVTEVDFQARKVHTKKAGVFNYETIILATGGIPRRLPLPGFDAKNVFVLRSVVDAKAINAALGDYKGKKVAIIGSSFIGIEIANCLAGKGSKVTVIGKESKPFEAIMGKTVGAVFQRIAEKSGVEFKMDANVERAEVDSSGNATSVIINGSEKIPADAIILAVGVRPATDYIKDQSLLLKDKSLEVDDNFKIKGVDHAYAVGDIATYPYYGPGSNGRALVRIEHWNVAQNSGREVSYHIASGKKPVAFTPVFWSALGVQLRYCGSAPNGYDDVIIKGQPDENKFVAYFTHKDEVVAVATMQSDPVMTQAAELMRRNLMPSKADIQKGVDVLSIPVPAEVRVPGA